MANLKNIIILSNKSSGSSACLKFLAMFNGIRHVEKTRHGRNETLYWTKAASVLGKPQISMLDSEVPIPEKRARRELIQMLAWNLPGYKAPCDDEALIFGGWKLLAQRFGPVFLEKSPHHLLQWSSLELILEAMKRLPEVDIFLIGLVRNPMDTLYSAFTRWKTPPEKGEHEWVRAYRNLLKLKDLAGDRLHIVRYEEMVADPAALEPLLRFLDRDISEADKSFFHQRSLDKWKNDRMYGFVPSDDLLETAALYGYDTAAMTNTSYAAWPLYKATTRIYHKTKKKILAI